jgi:myo-inositol 2-dehydrogenase/D-chiro-inositol 1-dehydrogenase
MTVRVGVIGTGMIGQDHVRRLTRVLSGAEVVAVSDVDLAVATEVAGGLRAARVHGTGAELVADPDVDAVVVASWGPTHEEYVLACIAADKPVFCEKPLATTQEACRRILDAEVALGRRVVQVGFMRRYDAAYRALKDVVGSGSIGAPLMLHSRHRNPSVPGHYTREMAITDTAVHDVDAARWLLEEELVSATVLSPRRSRHGAELQDPLLMIFRTESGALVDVETSVNIRYGYDIGGEVVGEDGTAALADSALVVVRHEGSYSGRVPADWRERFARAYDTELQEWIDALVSGDGAAGPSSWDGYAAAAVSDAAVEALHSGATVPVELGAKPDLYLKPSDTP